MARLFRRPRRRPAANELMRCAPCGSDFRGCDAIATALRRLDRERMTAEVEAFATALRLDRLDAADFGAPR